MLRRCLELMIIINMHITYCDSHSERLVYLLGKKSVTISMLHFLSSFFETSFLEQFAPLESTNSLLTFYSIDTHFNASTTDSF